MFEKSGLQREQHRFVCPLENFTLCSEPFSSNESVFDTFALFFDRAKHMKYVGAHKHLAEDHSDSSEDYWDETWKPSSQH